MGTMPMVDSVAVRHRRYLKNVVIPTFRRVSEDRVIKGHEIEELEEVLIGDARFVEAQAMISAVNVANTRSTDPRHFGDLISMRDATIALLPDAAA